MHRTLNLAVVLLIAGCGGAGIPDAVRPIPEPVTTPRPLLWGPGTGHYRVASHGRVAQEFQGRTQESVLQLVYFGTLELGRDTAQHLRASFIVDSVLADSAGVLTAADRSRAAGASFAATVLPSGQIGAESEADSLLGGRLRQIASGFWQAFPRIPATGVLPGHTWTDTTMVVSHSGDGTTTVRSVNRRQALPWGQVGTTQALPIRVESGYTIEGTGQQLGQPFQLSGSGTRTMVQYLSLDGRYLLGEAFDSASVEVLLTEMGLAIPGIQIRADTMYLLP